MFSALDTKERAIVIDAMKEWKFNGGDTVIKEKDDGNELYVVETGELDCYKTFVG
jgi:cAMP-dependent protein kinase regulator